MAIYQKIIEDIQSSIQSGQFKKGDKLPSIRQLSKNYHCSKDTVQKALLELKYQKDIYAVEKSGYYVLENKAEPSDDISLSLSAYNNLAYDDFLLCMNESLIGREVYLFNYYHKQEGLDNLLQSLKNYLTQGYVYTHQKNIAVTSGTQQALYILSQMVFPNQKESILLEQPTYYRMNDLVKSQHLPYELIKRDFNSLDLNYLEKVFSSKPIKFFYTISRYSNPLGLSYSQKEKETLVRLAEKYDVYIVEDDYMGDFTTPSDAPLHYYDTNDRVIYLKSFSATLFPALRLGTIVLPEKLKQGFLEYKTILDYDTNLIMQKALSLYLDNGMFEKNLRYLKRVFQHHLKEAQQLLSPFENNLRYQLTPRQATIELPKQASFGDFSRQKTFRKLKSSYIDCKAPAFIQLDLGEHFEADFKLLYQQLKQN